MFVGGSSGMVKTQMAFNMIHKATKDTENRLRVFYLMFPTDDNTKSIYRAFHKMSLLFRECLTKDMEGMYMIRTNCGSIYCKSLYSFGFMKKMLESSDGLSNASLVDIVPVQGTEIIGMLSSPFRSHLLHAIFIDEFFVQPASKEPQDYTFAMLFRNLFRSVGFVPILVGSNTKVFTMMNVSTHSRCESDSDDTWCFIMTDLCPFHPPNLVEFSAINTPAQNICLHSRPLFSSIFLTEYLHPHNLELSEYQRIEVAVQKVFRDVVGKVPILKTVDGLKGQVKLLLNEYCNVGNPLLLSHFGHLITGPENTEFFIDFWQCSNLSPYKGWDRAWKPLSKFPSASKDILLHLCFLDGPSRQIFGNSPFAFICGKIGLLTCETANSRMFMDMCLTAITCIATHSHGFAGIPLSQFIQNIGYHLLLENISASKCVVKDEEDLLEAIGNDIVPFHSSANQPWPVWFGEKTPEWNFGYLERTDSSSQIDLVGRTISGESKDCDKPLPSTVIESIVEKVKTLHSRCHVVFSREFEESYKLPFEKRNGIHFIKIAHSRSTVCISSVRGLAPPNKTDAQNSLVLLVELSPTDMPINSPQ